jgi:hydroxymethylpyrimidine pyrophosphatase-like HAD family hydrolase
MNFYGHWFDIVCVEEDAKKLQRFADAADWSGYGLMKYGGGGTRLAVAHSFLGKNRSLAAALRLAGVGPERVVVAGDEAADIAMMGPELSAFPLCPANASERVKAAVLARNGAVGGKPCCDGVMEAFEALSKREGWGFQLKALGCIA